jgi:nucleoporin POM152
MNNTDPQETPRIHGAFPATPQAQAPRFRPLARPFGDLRRPAQAQPGAPAGRIPATTTTAPTATGGGNGGTTVPPAVVMTAPGGPEPWIPTSLIDTPTQRLYAIALFVGLQAYKLYDLSQLWSGEEDITTLYFYMKWWCIDSLFFYNLPNFRIPWLHFNMTYTLYFIMGFIALDTIMPHFSSAPFTMLVGGLWKFIYDRELAVSERRVKWSDVIHNDTHIMGKYTIHILPEGMAKLNPNGGCYCLGPSSPSVTVPIKVNGTFPINIKMARADLDTSNVEIIELSQKEIKKLINKAPREETPDLKYLPYVIKQPGLYRLTKVKDVSEMDVRIHDSYALVVNCPKARIQPAHGHSKDVCKHDMSDLTIQLEGLAPLAVTYSRVVKGKPTTLSVGRIHPENFDSPLLSGFSIAGHLHDEAYKDLSTWAKRQTLSVPLNDSMTSAGDWLYEIDQVVDGCGNTVDYKAHQEEGDSWLPKVKGLAHKLVVHERPVVRFQGCDPQHPLEVPRGTRGVLPIKLDAAGSSPPYHLKVAYTPQDRLGSATEHSPFAEIQEFTYKSPSDLMTIRGPGLYSIRHISSQHCSGEVFEPASCLVVTPPEPMMTMEYDEILDKCTKSSVGLNIDLTLVGSPPFRLSYRLIKDDGPPVVKTLRIDRARHQERFTPEDPGHYSYEFFRLDDKNYEGVKIDPATHRVEQDVKPTASAHFINLPPTPRTVCIDEPVEFKIKMVGEGPWNLHYDLIHNGKRVRYTEKNINTTIHTIKTPPLSMGGEHSLALTSVEDRNGCKGFLESEAKINARFQRPKAQFSPIEGKMTIRALEGKPVKIPLRLTGEAVSRSSTWR